MYIVTPVLTQVIPPLDQRTDGLLPGAGEQTLGSSSSPPGQSAVPSHRCSGHMVTAELAQGIGLGH